MAVPVLVMEILRRDGAVGGLRRAFVVVFGVVFGVAPQFLVYGIMPEDDGEGEDHVFKPDWFALRNDDAGEAVCEGDFFITDGEAGEHGVRVRIGALSGEGGRPHADPVGVLAELICGVV